MSAICDHSQFFVVHCRIQFFVEDKKKKLFIFVWSRLNIKSRRIVSSSFSSFIASITIFCEKRNIKKKSYLFPFVSLLSSYSRYTNSVKYSLLLFLRFIFYCQCCGLGLKWSDKVICYSFQHKHIICANKQILFQFVTIIVLSILSFKHFFSYTAHSVEYIANQIAIVAVM